MGFFSVWPLFFCIAATFFFAGSPSFKIIDKTSSSESRGANAIDGVRGFLALAVYFYHATIYGRYVKTGIWAVPPNSFYTMLGETGVVMFFMITGFLFWGKVIKSKGRQNWFKMYVGRAFRIGPVYYFAIFIMFGVVFYHTGLHLHVSSGKLAIQIGRWLLMGLFVNPINGSGLSTLTLVGVTWTLQYEWLFYFSLPFTAFVARYRWAHLPFSIIGTITLMFVFSRTGTGYIYFPAIFGAGMIAASLNSFKLIPQIPSFLSSCLVIGLLAYSMKNMTTMFCAESVILTGLAFYLIASGSTIFGLLTSRAARRLGDISYGIYLLQGLVLTLIFSIGPVRHFQSATPEGHWAVTLIGALMLIILAAVVHLLIEYPGMNYGRYLIASGRSNIVKSSGGGPLEEMPLSVGIE